MYKIAIIGAGMCGLSCGNYLHKKGFDVTIFEKSRGVGGRMATKRIDDDLSVDHGAQYVTANSPYFKNFLDECISNGYASYWNPSGMDIHYLNKNKIFVGVPGMNNLVKIFSKNLKINFSYKVEKIQRKNNKWNISSENNELKEKFDLVVFAIPAKQVIDIISQDEILVNELSKVVIDPCWSLILVTQKKLGCNDYNRFDDSNFASVVYNGSKPKRNKEVNSYIVHTRPEWTKKNLFLEPYDVELKICNALSSKLKEDLDIKYIKAHRWLYAQTKKPLGKSFLSSKDSSLFIGGDWCLGANAESAFISGLEIAKFIIKI